MYGFKVQGSGGILVLCRKYIEIFANIEGIYRDYIGNMYGYTGVLVTCGMGGRLEDQGI